MEGVLSGNVVKVSSVGDVLGASILFRSRDFCLERRGYIVAVHQVWSGDLIGRWWKHFGAFAAAGLGNAETRSVFVAEGFDTAHQ